MRHWYEWPGAVAILVVAATPTGANAQQRVIVSDGPSGAGEAKTLARALDLLPIGPSHVAVIDASRARPDVRDTMQRLDAFVVRDSAVVYVVRQSTLLRGARAGSSIHLHALAAAIWHEMAHLDGADEREARHREQALWTIFIRDQRVDRVDGLRYLAALERRPDHPIEARGDVAR